MDIQVDKQVEIKWLKEQISYLEELMKSEMLDRLHVNRMRRLERYKKRLEKLEKVSNCKD
ncbi:hypothetical protein [Enterococcus olivae]